MNKKLTSNSSRKGAEQVQYFVPAPRLPVRRLARHKRSTEASLPAPWQSLPAVVLLRLYIAGPQLNTGSDQGGRNRVGADEGTTRPASLRGRRPHTRTLIASRSVRRLTRSWETSALSDGNTSPGCNSPELIRSATDATAPRVRTGMKQTAAPDGAMKAPI